MRVAVLPVRFAPGLPPDAETAARLRQGLEARLAASPSLEPAGERETDAAWALTGGDEAPLDEARARELGRRLDAQGVVELVVGGYGKVAAGARARLLGAGLAASAVSGAGLGLWLGPWVGAGWAAATALRSTAEWTSGAWLFRRWFTPVVLSAALLSSADGRRVWSASTARSFHPPSAGIDWTASRALQDLSDALQSAARRNGVRP
jgi:hypothetical protein